MLRALAFVAVLLSLPGAAVTTAADAGQGTYRIRLTYRGIQGPYTCPGATSANSTDILEGTVSGRADADRARGNPIVFTGTLLRKTDLSYCDLRSDTGDTAVYCGTHLSGGGRMRARITIEHDRPGAHVELEWVASSARIDATTGDCDAEIVDGIRELYLREGEGAEFATVPVGPLVVGASYRQPSRGPGDPIGPWTFEVLKSTKLRAVPGGPYAVVRGQEIVLDGSRSEGDITDYVWKIAMKDCELADGQPVNAEVELHGARIPIRPLCDIDARLKVTDGTEWTDPPVAAQIDFSARPWKTKVTTFADDLLDAGLVKPCGCELGRNICAVERRAGKMNSGHYFHKPEGSPTYEGSQYRLARNTDPSGLFDQWWWVAKSMLGIERAELVNVLLTKDQTLRDQNSGSTREGFELLVASVRRHEAIHSKLIEKGVGAPDPAEKIETMIQLPSARPEPLRPCADAIIKQSEGFIESTDTEGAVIQQMIDEETYDVYAEVRLREAQKATYDVQRFPKLARESDRPVSGTGTGPSPSGFAPCSALNAPSIPSSGEPSSPPR
jgi:hypothetical protein